jgi:hypothetical protein
MPRIAIRQIPKADRVPVRDSMDYLIPSPQDMEASAAFILLKRF